MKTQHSKISTQKSKDDPTSDYLTGATFAVWVIAITLLGALLVVPEAHASFTQGYSFSLYEGGLGGRTYGSYVMPAYTGGGGLFTFSRFLAM